MVRRDQLQKLRDIFETHPTIVAAKGVIEARLLGGGLHLKVDGVLAEISPELADHIDDCWLPFARDLVHSVLVCGFAVVSYEAPWK